MADSFSKEGLGEETGRVVGVTNEAGRVDGVTVKAPAIMTDDRSIVE